MSAPPYMPLYVADYLGDTTHLSQGEHGAYMLLLMAMWRNGGWLPSDDAKLARFSRSSTGAHWARIKPTLMAFFVVEGDRIVQPRLVKEAAKYEALTAQKSRAGAISAERKAIEKAKKLSTAVDVPLQQPEPEPELEEKKKDSLTTFVSPKTAKKTRRCPPDYLPSEAVLGAGREVGLTDTEMAFELAKMRDHQFRDAHNDWDAAFRNWLRRAGERPRGRSGQPPLLSFAAQDMLIEAEGTRRFMENMEARNGHTTRSGDRLGNRGAVIALPRQATGS